MEDGRECVGERVFNVGSPGKADDSGTLCRGADGSVARRATKKNASSHVSRRDSRERRNTQRLLTNFWELTMISRFHV